MDIFLNLHAVVHSSAVSEGTGEWYLAEQLLAGLSEAQLRECPAPGTNSIVWLFWHMTRTEDVAMNLLVAERPQVLDEAWLARLGLNRRDIGTAMTADDVSDVSSKVNIEALFEYRDAVGRRTREIAQTITPEELDVVIDDQHIRRLNEASALIAEAYRVAQFWQGKTKRFLFNMPGSGHQMMHLSEALATRRMLKRG